MQIETQRLILRPWRDGDMPAFAAIAADPEVMRDLGGPMDRATSDAKLGRYAATYGRVGYCRWAVTSRAGVLLGYAGIMPLDADHPLAGFVDIGWRLARHAWGHGYASEAARAALDDAFGRLGLSEVVAFTAPDNRRSQGVMKRAGMRRDPERDFVADFGAGRRSLWLVWVAEPAA